MWAHKNWAGSFFPAKTKQRDYLAEYSRRLNTVEGNTTFYALPDIVTLERWRDEAAPGFQFCLKTPRTISHELRLVGAEQETAAFCDHLERLGAKRGPAFLQLPPSFDARQLPALDDWLSAWPRRFALAVEPRHADFFGAAEADFLAVLRGHGAARCIFDTTALFALPSSYSPDVADAHKRKPRFPLRDDRSAAFAFVRFVGQPDLDANTPYLTYWVERAARWLAHGDACYFFFHSPDDTHAPALLRRFHEMLATRANIPALPAWGDPEQPVQGTLFG